MNPDNLEFVKTLLLQSFPDADVVVGDLTGTFDHLDITITSNAFAGLSLLKQHQLVMDCLKESLKQRIHAVKLNTKSK